MQHNTNRYDKLALFYYSGTGNTYRTACWIKEEAVALGIGSELLPVDDKSPRPDQPGPGTITGIGMPTHGFTLPWTVVKFIMRMPRGRGAPAFVWSTRAGAKYGPIPGYPPGITGSSIFIAALLLLLRGYRVRGMMSVNMPSNWMSLHSGLRSDIVDTIIKRADPVVRRFARKILSGGHELLSLNIIYELIFAVALLPVSAGYLAMGRFGLAKLFFANNKCTGCGVCAKNCPTGSIRMRGKRRPLPYWTYSCESCMRCMGYCPHRAIEASQPLAGLLFYLTAYLPVSTILYVLLAKHAEFMPQSLMSGASLLLYAAYCYFMFFAAYLLFWSLSRLRLLNNLFRFTTLTCIYRRYHEPTTAVSLLKKRRDARESE